MKRRGMFLKGFVAAFIVVAVSTTGVAQTTQSPPQPPPQVQSKDQPQAQRQWKIYMESDTRKYYFDPASVQKLDKRVVRVWERITKADKDGSEIEKVQSLMELDCGSSKYRVVSSKDYDRAKPGEEPEIRMENGPWTYFSLDTVLGILYDNVCFTSSKPATAPKAPAKPKEEPKFGQKASPEKPTGPEEEPTFRK